MTRLNRSHIVIMPRTMTPKDHGKRHVKLTTTIIGAETPRWPISKQSVRRNETKPPAYPFVRITCQRARRKKPTVLVTQPTRCPFRQSADDSAGADRIWQRRSPSQQRNSRRSHFSWALFRDPIGRLISRLARATRRSCWTGPAPAPPPTRSRPAAPLPAG